MTNRAPNSTKNGSLIMMAILALQLSSAASEPEIAAAGWAPRLHETLRRAAAVGSDEPFVVPTTGGGPPPNLTLRTILEPFASKLSRPFVKLTNGAGGESTARTDLPGTLDEVVEMMTRPSDPWSVVLCLEELDPESDRMPPLFQDLLAPVLALSSKQERNTTTAHVYISGAGASALPNHTDVTEIVVLQLLGRKEWLYCREKPPSATAAAATLFPLEAKPDKYNTYSAQAEVDSDALECERAVTSPGDTLFLPRRTVHSAHAIDGSYSVHLTVGVKSSGKKGSSRQAGLQRRLDDGSSDDEKGWAIFGIVIAVIWALPGLCGIGFFISQMCKDDADDIGFNASAVCLSIMWTAFGVLVLCVCVAVVQDADASSQATFGIFIAVIWMLPGLFLIGFLLKVFSEVGPPTGDERSAVFGMVCMAITWTAVGVAVCYDRFVASL